MPTKLTMEVRMNDRQVACVIAAIVYGNGDVETPTSAAATAMDLLAAVHKAWDADPRVGLPELA